MSDSATSKDSQPAKPAAEAETLPPAAPSGSGADLTPPPPGSIPSALADHPRYRLIRLLGRGGMGGVYLAEHRHMERQVALKVISADLVGNPDAIRRFRQEVTAAARLGPHPNVVTVYDADQVGDLHFLVMEYIEGQDLAEYLHQTGALPTAEACDYCRQAALGLQHASLQGMVHRDVKPHNLMRTPQGHVKVLDFGLARLHRESEKAHSQLTQQGVLMGTADYMAPEQANDSRSADLRADVYSLGCTLYHLLTGRVPFPDGGTVEKIVKHAVEAPTPVGSLRPDLPVGVAQIVEKMMAKAPEQRFQTPGEAAEALAPWTTAGAAFPIQPVMVSPPSATLPLAQAPAEVGGPADGGPKRTRRWRIGLSGGTMLVCVVGFVASLVPTTVKTEPFWGLRGFAGGSTNNPDEPSVVLTSIDHDSPAAAAGLREGDRLMAVNGTPVNFGNLRQLIADVQPNRQVTLELRRGESFVKIITHISREPAVAAVVVLRWQFVSAPVFLALFLTVVATPSRKSPAIWRAILVTAAAVVVLTALAVVETDSGIKWAIVRQFRTIPLIPNEAGSKLTGAVLGSALVLSILGALSIRASLAVGPHGEKKGSG